MAALPSTAVDSKAADLATALQAGSGVDSTPADHLSIASFTFPALTLGTALAVVATTLLVFVSVGVIYLSTVEWRDRRRRGSPTPRS
jgi:hypothetical protein